MKPSTNPKPRRLMQEGAIYTLAAFAPRIAQFLALPILLRLLPQDEVGAVALLNLVVALGLVIIDFGASGAASRFVFSHKDLPRSTLTSTLLRRVALSGVLALAVSEIGGPKVSPVLLGFDYGLAARVVVLAAVFGSLSAIFLAILRADGRAARFGSAQVVLIATQTIGSLSLVALGYGIEGYALGVLAGQAAQLAVLLFTGRTWIRGSRDSELARQ
ncbi:MAG: oligosaccharide flippase family protein, partial [Acidimicrobiia bacterium]|nr:oligosaccharide flippase family protein [Acidimicrobiia bacterium]